MQTLVSNSRRLLAIAVVGIASVAAYVNTLGHGFVYDDAMQILQNPWIKDVSHLREIFTKSVWGFHSGGASNYYSILFHTANSFLVLLLVERLLPSKTTGVSVSFVAALLFAVHPIHSEVVAWACGITDASFTFFLLLSWVLYLASRQTVGTWAYLASLVAFFFSLLCKEPAVVLPGLLLASDYAFGSADEKLSRRLIRYAPFLVVVGAYLVLRFNALGGFFAALPQRESGLWASLLNGMVLFTRYLGRLLLPTGLSAYHALMPVKSLAEPRAMAAVIVVLAYGGFCLWSFRKNGRSSWLWH